MKRFGSVLTAVFVLALVTPAYAAVSQSTWSMDELSGSTLMLDSTGTNNGTLHGVTLEQPGRPGSSGPSYGFDGLSSYVFVHGNSSLNPGNQDFTLTAWLDLSGKPGTGSSDYDIIRKGSGWKMEMFPHNGVVDAQCVYAGSTRGSPKVNLHAPQQNGNGLDDHAWHVVTCTRDASGETLTVDGVVVATSSVQIGNISNTADVYVGAQAAGIDFYDGLMDDVSLSIGTVAPPAVAGFTPPSGPVGTIVDITGSGFTGASDVTFGGVSVGTAGFTVNSDADISATVPAAAASGPVCVTNGTTGCSPSSYTVLCGGTIQRVGQIGTASNTSGVFQSGLTVTVANPVAQGDTVVLAVGAQGNVSVVSASDSRGNTYHVDSVRQYGGATGSSSTTAIVTASASNALQPGDTITVSLTKGNTWGFVAEDWSGLCPTALDQTGTADSVGAQDTTVSVSTSSATNAPTEAVFAVTTVAGWPGLTAGSGYTESADVQLKNGASARRELGLEYGITNTTGTQMGTFTLGAASYWVAAISTYD